MGTSNRTLLFLLALLAGTPAQASQAEGPGPGPLYALDYGLQRDLALTGASLLAWGSSEFFFKSQLTSAQCRWCETDLRRLNGLDRFGRRARWSDENLGAARALSNIVPFALLPIATVGTDLLFAYREGPEAKRMQTMGVDLLIVTQSVAISGVLNQAVKFSVRRERPFVAALPAEEKGFTDAPLDNNVSFYSGHTSFAFSLAVSSGTVATLRNYPNRWLIWATGLPLAASVGYFRIAADKHYLSDVLVGATVGSAVGVAVPLLLHRRVGTLTGGTNVSLSVSAHPRGLSLSGAF